MICRDDLVVPSWHPPELAAHARDLLHIWSAVGEPTDMLHDAAQRILLDDRMRPLWPVLEEMFFAGRSQRSTLRAIQRDWSEFQRRLFVSLVTRGGAVSRKPAGEMRKDRADLANSVRRLRHKIRATEDPSVLNLNLGTLLRRQEKRPGNAGEAARAIPRVSKWTASGITLDDLLADLVDAFEAGEPLSGGDQIDPSPFDPPNRGGKNAPRTMLENRLLCELQGLKDPIRPSTAPQAAIARLVDALTAIAFGDDDPYSSTLAQRLAAEKSKKNSR